MTDGAKHKEDVFDAVQILRDTGDIPDSEISLGRAALAIAATQHPGISVQRYLHHLEVLGEEVQARHKALLDEGAEDSPETQLAALKHILHDQHGYLGDKDSYDDLQNASLIRVIDRAKGLPITLSILYIHTGQALGWDVCGLNMPGHFVCRIEKDGQRVMFDPFDGCQILNAPELRGIVKRALGENAELAAEYYEPVSNREVLIRLENNVKFRQIEIEDYAGALETVRRMRQIDPSEYRLLLEEGVLLARTDAPQEALDVLAGYIEKAPRSRDRMEAELLMQQIHEQLNL